VNVRVPGSSSNLGSGFDCVGVAIDRWLSASVSLGAGQGIELRRAGRLAVLTVPPEEDLLVRGFRAACDAGGVQWAGKITIDAASDIPVGCGLGSSAAALVAGALLADAALGLGLKRERVAEIAAAIEGHPDNVAPALFGGAVLSVPTSSGLHSSTLVVAPGLAFVLAVPPFPSDTKTARAALPASLSHADAVRAAGRAAALIQGLATGDGALLAVALDDLLHVPFRRAGLAGYDAVVAAAKTAGAHGATLSGAGSAILALAPAERVGAVGAAMLEAWRAAGVAAELVVCSRPAGGASVTHTPRSTHSTTSEAS
jgi:homoserine kinase